MTYRVKNARQNMPMMQLGDARYFDFRQIFFGYPLFPAGLNGIRELCRHPQTELYFTSAIFGGAKHKIKEADVNYV